MFTGAFLLGRIRLEAGFGRGRDKSLATAADQSPIAALFASNISGAVQLAGCVVRARHLALAFALHVALAIVTARDCAFCAEVKFAVRRVGAGDDGRGIGFDVAGGGLDADKGSSLRRIHFAFRVVTAIQDRLMRGGDIAFGLVCALNGAVAGARNFAVAIIYARTLYLGADARIAFRKDHFRRSIGATRENE